MKSWLKKMLENGGVWDCEYTTKDGAVVKETDIDFLHNIMYFNKKPVFLVWMDPMFLINPREIRLHKYSLFRRELHSIETFTFVSTHSMQGSDTLGNTITYTKR